MGLCSIIDDGTLVAAIIRFRCMWMTDRQTDRQTRLSIKEIKKISVRKRKSYTLLLLKITYESGKATNYSFSNEHIKAAFYMLKSQ